MLNIESTEPAAITMSCLLFKHASEQGFHCLETFLSVTLLDLSIALLFGGLKANICNILVWDALNKQYTLAAVFRSLICFSHFPPVTLLTWLLL